MFRKMTPSDVPEVLLMMREFYHSPAVLHPVPDANFEATVREVLSGSPYADLYLLCLLYTSSTNRRPITPLP